MPHLKARFWSTFLIWHSQLLVLSVSDSPERTPKWLTVSQSKSFRMVIINNIYHEVANPTCSSHYRYQSIRSGRLGQSFHFASSLHSKTLLRWISWHSFWKSTLLCLYSLIKQSIQRSCYSHDITWTWMFKFTQLALLKRIICLCKKHSKFQTQSS